MLLYFTDTLSIHTVPLFVELYKNYFGLIRSETLATLITRYVLCFFCIKIVHRASMGQHDSFLTYQSAKWYSDYIERQANQ